MTAVREPGALEGYAAPASLAEAAQLCAGGATTMVAGGTDLMPRVQAGMPGLDGTLVNLRRVAELGGIGRDGGAIRIGALVTIADILDSNVIAADAPVLAETADCFASDQIRNMATIGGNICNASPAGDMIVPLLLLDAEASLARWSNGALHTRRVALSQFFTGPGRTVRAADEILVTVSFEAPGENFAARFRKFGPRPALEVALAAVGVAGNRRDGGLHDARVAFGAVAPTPMRGFATEATLEGRPLGGEIIAAAGRAAEQEVSPISDVRASDWYRRHLVRVLTGEVLGDVADG